MKCKVIRVSGYHDFALTIERKINEALEEIRRESSLTYAMRVVRVEQSIAHGIGADIGGHKEERLHALITIFYE